jgi:hypothetical protein
MEQVLLGKWTKGQLDRTLIEALKINDTGNRIDFLSKHFLNTRYKESTLIGNISTPEILVINLEEVDCFTFIDYIEAMRRSGSYLDFRKNLVNVRYRSGEIDYKNRNHFFTDWKAFNTEFIVDVTLHIGAENTECVSKRLNDKVDGKSFLPGIPCLQRKVEYIPTALSNDTVMAGLKTGDYVGLYSNIKGLDVSHVGIIIRKGDSVSIRHASSAAKQRKVLDEDFKNYLANKPGFIVLRPRD